MISGVHEHGCGFEAQNEAWYRFLIQPDPFDHIEATQLRDRFRVRSGVDAVIFQQRAAFLRPDSLLAVIAVTDENEDHYDPVSFYDEGWLFENYPWPGCPGGVARRNHRVQRPTVTTSANNASTT